MQQQINSNNPIKSGLRRAVRIVRFLDGGALRFVNHDGLCYIDIIGPETKQSAAFQSFYKSLL